MQSDDFKRENPIDEIWIKNYKVLEEMVKSQKEVIALHEQRYLYLEKQLQQSTKPVFYFNVN
ncbi:MAG: hypothetical protein CMP76_07980 [Flavobacterium sp.]|uniref:hypothetical protein n=1 Tax=Flavobacterium sp. TaxID=239 RepID=UPI000C52501F|nr:hypothetical protein [Flavobacterium sp.]MBF03219.1 hypothetical protein [Flavobacterium sp.]|tara:strand:+ start:766 stop:951 length:186 start_codon:yes stop_codon:yes gene_type:complete